MQRLIGTASAMSPASEEQTDDSICHSIDTLDYGRMWALDVFIQAKAKAKVKVKAEAKDYRGYGGFYDLRCPSDDQQEIVDAMVLPVICEPESSCTVFRQGAEKIRIPIFPHCKQLPNQKHHAYDCEGDDSSFAQFKDDYIVSHAFGRGTGAFIEDDVIITAFHNIKPDKLTQTYFIMEMGNPGCGWAGEDSDGVPGLDYLEVDRRHVLAVADMILPGGNRDADWIKIRVKPLVEGDEIPQHPKFMLATEPPPNKTKIIVPSYPRQLPLKIADGVIHSHDAEGGMRAYFDVAGGSSGSPLLLADDPRVIVGIVKGANWRDPREETCKPDVDGHEKCPPQPCTSTHIIENRANP